MQHHKIYVSKPSLIGKFHDLSAQYATSNSCIFYSGASHHMTHSNELLSPIFDCSISHIAIRDST